MRGSGNYRDDTFRKFGKILKKWSWDAGERKGCGTKSSLVCMGDTRTCPYIIFSL